MDRLLRVSFLSIVFIVSTFGAQQRKDYFTPAEVDYLRDAQEPLQRIRTYIKFADNRLILLGLKQETNKEKDQNVRDRKKYEQEAKDAKKQGQDLPLAPLDPQVYLKDFSRPELLRGYMQAINEAMDNLDDYYERKLDMRAALEEFSKFTGERGPLLKTFQTRTDGELAVLQEATELTEKSHMDAVDALEIVPRTEKKSAKP